MALLAQMENRAVMAETMLEATLQYQSSQQKALSPLPSPRYLSPASSNVCSTKRPAAYTWQHIEIDLHILFLILSEVLNIFGASTI